MLKLTKRLRKYAIARWKLAEDATDKDIRTLLGRKLLANVITPDDIARINEGKRKSREPARAGSSSGSGTERRRKSADRRDDDEGRDRSRNRRNADRGQDQDRDRRNRDDREERSRRRSTDRTDRGNGDTGRTQKDFDRMVRRSMERQGFQPQGGGINPSLAFSKSARIRVKEAADNYSRAKRAAVYPAFRGIKGASNVAHPFAGQPVNFNGQGFDTSSELDKAIGLAWVRYQAARSNDGKSLPRWLRMTEHDKQLVLYAVHNEKWVGVMEDRDMNTSVIERSRLSDIQRKTLLDDTNSGGIEISPVVFDDAIILTPILYGELFPYISVTTLARGRRVKGGAMANPTFSWGTAEGTAITPFNTASFISAFDTPIYACTAAIELGMDFEEDTPVNLGGQVIEQFGLKALEELDRVVAIGDGMKEPLGLFNTVTATVMNSAYGAGGPMTVSDYEGLMLTGLQKQYRTEAGAYLAYVSNDYGYRKAVSIPVGPGDERRVFGMDHQEYRLLKTDYKVQNGIPDGWLAYVNLRRYRMYRRLGMQVRIETGGRQLAMSNTRLIVVRMRYGGQMELGGAVALMKDAQVM